MINPVIARRRLRSQLLAGSPARDAVDVVRRLGAVQAQVINSAKWAVGQRAGVTDAEVQQALDDGRILRLHLMRPTWHFVAADDVRWLLSLTAGRVHRGNAARYRQLDIDDAARLRFSEVLRSTLSGGRQLSRAEIETAANQAGISTAQPQRLVHLLMGAELDGVICSGAWDGKQATYALLDERVPQKAVFDRKTSLAELAGRYFTSHGPASLKDFVWWSGLTATEAREAIALAYPPLQQETIDDQVMWSREVDTGPEIIAPRAHLLPSFDEYTVAYTRRDAVFDARYAGLLHISGGVLDPVILIDGMVAGSWKRSPAAKTAQILARPFWTLAQEEEQALERAAQRYGEFLNLPVQLEIEPHSSETKNL